MRHEAHSTGLFAIAECRVHDLDLGRISGHLFFPSDFRIAFPALDLVFVFHQEINVVESIHQAIFLISVDLKPLALSGGIVGHRLVGTPFKVYFFK